MINKLQKIIDLLIETGKDKYISFYNEYEGRQNLVNIIYNSKLNDEIGIEVKYINGLEKFMLYKQFVKLSEYLECDVSMAQFLLGNSRLNLGRYIVDFENLHTFLNSKYLDVSSTNHTTHDIHLISVKNGLLASFSDMVKFLKFMLLAFEKNTISLRELPGRQWLNIVNNK